MLHRYSVLTVTNCLFSNNSAEYNGGGLYNYSVNSKIINSTFSGNLATSGGGTFSYDCNPTITNCIFWNNTPEEIYGGSPVVSYCDIQDWVGGTGNINADPNFVDADNPELDLKDFRLNPGSPCIDAGNNTAITAGIFTDLDGNPRVVDDPDTPDTGITFSDLTVDMGAYEFEFDPCPVEGDINCDGIVDLNDLSILCANWLQGTSTCLLYTSDAADE